MLPRTAVAGFPRLTPRTTATASRTSTRTSTKTATMAPFDGLVRVLLVIQGPRWIAGGQARGEPQRGRGEAVRARRTGRAMIAARPETRDRAGARYAAVSEASPEIRHTDDWHSIRTHGASVKQRSRSTPRRRERIPCL